MNDVVIKAVEMILAAGHKPTIKQGKHVKITWIQDGRKRLLVCAASPSDRRAIYKMRSDLRRMLGRQT